MIGKREVHRAQPQPHPPITSMGCSHSADVALCSYSELQVTCGSEGPWAGFCMAPSLVLGARVLEGSYPMSTDSNHPPTHHLPTHSSTPLTSTQLSTHPLPYPSTSQSIYPSTLPSIVYPSLSTHPLTHPSICSSIFSHPFIHPSPQLPIHPSSIYPFIHPPIYPIHPPPVIHSPNHPPTYITKQPLIYPFSHPSKHPSMHPPTYPSTAVVWMLSEVWLYAFSCLCFPLSCAQHKPSMCYGWLKWMFTERLLD